MHGLFHLVVSQHASKTKAQQPPIKSNYSTDCKILYYGKERHSPIGIQSIPSFIEGNGVAYSVCTWSLRLKAEPYLSFKVSELLLARLISLCS